MQQLFFNYLECLYPGYHSLFKTKSPWVNILLYGRVNAESFSDQIVNHKCMLCGMYFTSDKFANVNVALGGIYLENLAKKKAKMNLMKFKKTEYAV